MNEKIQTNEIKAGPNEVLKYLDPIARIGEQADPSLKENLLRPIYEKVHELAPLGKSYKEGMDPDIRKELEEVYYDEIKKLEKRTNRNLNLWFEFLK